MYSSDEIEKKEEVFDDLMARGKVVMAMKRKVFDTFSTAEQMADFYKIAPEVVAEKDRPLRKNQLTDAEQDVVDSGLYNREEILATRKVTSGDRRRAKERRERRNSY